MKRVFISSFLFLVVLLLYLSISLTKRVDVNQDVYIKKNSSTKDIAFLLSEKRVINDPIVFIILSKIKGGSLKAGYYQFNGKLSMMDVHSIITKGLVKRYIFTIIPGDNLITISEKLHREGIIDKQVFLKFVFSKENVKNYGLEGDTFEGYFPPQTYYIPYKADIYNIVDIFLKEFKEKYLPYKDLFKNRDISFYEGMIIASMVEKEAYLEEEKPIISGVILNRLKKGMRLQIDATVIYALELSNTYKGKLNKEDMDIESPFNTYNHYGLPPTPISNFKISSLISVLNPEKHNFLYYVLSRDRKKHKFTDNYNEHIRNIRESFK